MNAAILAIGDELLEGRIDTNSNWIEQALDRIGCRVLESRQCRDDIDVIVRNLNELSAIADVVITTGGLGPTTDDLTTDAVCHWAGVGKELHQETWEWIQARFKERGYELPPSNIKQAEYPQGARVIRNRNGSALGYLAEKSGRYVATFPGVPREMKAMVENDLIPFLTEHFGRQGYRAIRRLKIFGHTESGVNQLMDGIAKDIPGLEVAYLVHYPEVNLFFKVTRPTEEEAAQVADSLVLEAKRRLGDKCYGEGEATLEATVGQQLKQLGLIMGTAESCTGGLVAQRLTDIAGSSAYFSESVVTYSNDAKARLLGVKKETLKEFGAVSAETCGEMIEGLFAKTKVDVGIAITGIAGPAGGTPEKPVGLVYIAWGDREGYEVREFRFHGLRQDIRQVTASTALDLVRRFLLRKLPA
jgi:nicotinamide-nucleotide amidase